MQAFFQTFESNYDLDENIPVFEWLKRLVWHTGTLCLEAREKITGQLMLDVGLSIPVGKDVDDEEAMKAVFHAVYSDFWHEAENKLAAFENAITDEMTAEWKEAGTYPENYIALREKLYPDCTRTSIMAKFLRNNYEALTGQTRALTDLAFAGFLESAMKDPHFARLCKDKGLETSSMTREERLNAPLDHDALYDFLEETLASP